MSIIIMILLLSFLVLVHEAGHFYAARALGIKVSKFGFGLPIGPTLWSKQVGDVEVLVHAFLLGGYVSFPDDEKESGVVIPDEDKFMNKPVWKRMIVISAGVIANIITAIVFVLITAFVWGKLPSGQYEVYINKIVAEKSESVWASGLEKGDRIIKINGSDINSSYALNLYSKNSKRYDGKVDKTSVDETLDKLKNLNPKLVDVDLIEDKTVVVLPKKVDELALTIEDEALKGYKLYKDNQIALSDTQAKLRDLLKDKTTYKADGTTTLADVAYAITDTQRPMNITVLRDGKEIALKTVYSNEKGLIGVMVEAREVLRPTKDIPSAL